jgi:hypothetical protein
MARDMEAVETRSGRTAIRFCKFQANVKHCIGKSHAVAWWLVPTTAAEGRKPDSPARRAG